MSDERHPGQVEVDVQERLRSISAIFDGPFSIDFRQVLTVFVLLCFLDSFRLFSGSFFLQFLGPGLFTVFRSIFDISREIQRQKRTDTLNVLQMAPASMRKTKARGESGSNSSSQSKQGKAPTSTPTGTDNTHHD